MTPAAAREILHDGALDFDEVKRRRRKRISAVAVPLRAAVEIRNEVSSVTATNVVATLNGTLPDYVLYSAQWNDFRPADSPAAISPTPIPAISRRRARRSCWNARALVRDERAPDVRVPDRDRRVQRPLGVDYYLRNPVYPLRDAGRDPHGGLQRPERRSAASLVGTGFRLEGAGAGRGGGAVSRGGRGCRSRAPAFLPPAEGLYGNGDSQRFLSSRHAAEAAGTGPAAAAGPVRHVRSRCWTRSSCSTSALASPPPPIGPPGSRRARSPRRVRPRARPTSRRRVAPLRRRGFGERRS